METTAILLLHCPDQQGIISEVTKFITDNKGNIVYLDTTTSPPSMPSATR